MVQNTQLSLLIEVVEYVQDDNGVDAAEVGIGDVANLKLRPFAQGKPSAPHVPRLQFNASE